MSAVGPGSRSALRLVARFDDRIVRLQITESMQVLGSSDDCQLQLDHPTVSRRHAEVRRVGDHVVLRDLDSLNGLQVRRRRVREVRLGPGDRLVIGSVPVEIEAVPEGDFEVAIPFGVGSHGSQSPDAELTPADADRVTRDGDGAAELALDHLPGVLELLTTGAGPVEVAQQVGKALHSSLQTTRVVVARAQATRGMREAHDEPRAILFTAERELTGTLDGGPHRVSAERGPVTVEVELAMAEQAHLARRLVESAVRLVLLADGSQPQTPADARARPDPRPLPPLPAPPTLSPLMQQIYRDAGRVARGNVSVLVLGESGTGKEVLARWLHDASPRAARGFVSLNCASLPRDLLEAELFGIERAVATGVDARPGTFELADGGTLLLDEIGDMEASTQAKILRVLQSGEVYRLGSSRARQVDVRIVAATNQDLASMRAAGTFREDLYHRLAGWVVELPPLRRRPVDIANLAAYFLEQEARRHGVRVGGVSRAALDALEAYRWPGNVRQLENAMRRAVLFLEPGELLDSVRLDVEVRSGSRGTTLEEGLAMAEREILEHALACCDHQVEPAAARLGISRATLYRRLKALGLTPRDPDR